MKYKYELLSKYRTQLMGVAILWVILFHSTINLSSVPILREMKLIGYGGVDIFLMLSGLGLYFAYQKSENCKHFYKKRLLRILPTYLSIVLIYSLAANLIGDNSLSDLLLNLTTLSFWFNIKSRFDWYIPAIIVLYLLTPAIIHFFNRTNKFITIAAGIMIGLSISMVIPFTPLNYLLIFTTRIPIFMVGIFLGYWIDIKRECSSRSVIFSLLIFTLGSFLLAAFIRSFQYEIIWKYGLWWYPFLLITLPFCMIITVVFQWIAKHGGYKFPVLFFCGRHSLELYLFSTKLFEMSEGNMVKKYISNRIIINVFCIVLSFIMALLWKKIVGYSVRKVEELCKSKVDFA